MTLGNRHHGRNNEGSSNTNNSDGVSHYEMKEIQAKEREINSIAPENEVEYFENTMEKTMENLEYEGDRKASHLRRFIDSFKRAEGSHPNSPTRPTPLAVGRPPYPQTTPALNWTTS